MGEIAARDYELRPEAPHELAEGLVDVTRGRRPATHVEIREVQDSHGHGRGRLYTRIVATESPELFDDIYLGLQAGGAARKQRKGQPLSAEEAEVLGRWQRLSLWRKLVAVGAFALGTFGLGFTVGGLVFGRWRKA